METKTSTPAVARRNFLKASTGLAAGAAITATTPRFLTAAERARSIGANSRIRIAQINGCLMCQGYRIAADLQQALQAMDSDEAPNSAGRWLRSSANAFRQRANR